MEYSIGNTSSKGPLFIAMLVYRSVTGSGAQFLYNLFWDSLMWTSPTPKQKVTQPLNQPLFGRKTICFATSNKKNLIGPVTSQKPNLLSHMSWNPSLSSCWLNQPLWKILVKMEKSPSRGEQKKMLKPPPSSWHIAPSHSRFNGRRDKISRMEKYLVPVQAQPTPKKSRGTREISTYIAESDQRFDVLISLLKN